MRVLLKALLLLIIAYSGSAQPQAHPDSFYDIRDSVLIQTKDGHFISSTIVMRKGNRKPLPVILFFTTYYQGKTDSYFGKISVDKDYVGVVAYSRGIRTDLNDYFPYENDGNDIYDLIDWISKQWWCNGKVGMFGGSYTGFVQWSAVKKTHPALKTIVPQVAVMPGFDSPMENNVPQGFALSWPNDILNFNPLPKDLSQSWYEKGTSYRTLDSLARQPDRIFQKWLQHPGYDNYWKSLVPSPDEYANINIPILCTTGYYDGAQIGALKYVKDYFRYNKNPNLYLVNGPYDHYGAQRGMPADTLMGYPIDNVAKKSMRGLAFEWFDYILKDKKIPEILKDKINYEVMGADQWKHVPSLQRMNNDTFTLYLSGRKNVNDYSLINQKSENETFIEQTVDFNDRSSQNNYYTPFIINDSLDKSNGLVFITEPYTKSFVLNGCFFGNLICSINKKDMDVSIAFYEQMPDSKFFFLTRYLGRASYSRDKEKRNLMTPDKRESIPFDNTRMVSRQISLGSRLLIILNINKHPFEEINYGTGKNVHDETIADSGEPLRIKWYSDSFIKIPVWIDRK
jgi:putative CocE/NonD family hydrolase